MTMDILCLFPMQTFVQLMIVSRIFLSIIGIFILFFSPPTSLPAGWIADQITKNISSHFCLSLVSPTLCMDLFSNTLILMGIWSTCRSCIVPWMLFNFLVIIGLGAGVIFHLNSVFFPALDHHDSGNLDKIETVLKDIHGLIKIILLNVILALEMATVCGVVNVFVNLKIKSVTSCDRRNAWFYEKRSEMRKANESIDCEIRKDERTKDPVPLIHVGEKDKKRDSWETLRFMYNIEYA